MENKFLVDKYKDKVTVLENGSVIADVELWDEMSKLIKKNKEVNSKNQKWQK